MSEQNNNMMYEDILTEYDKKIEVDIFTLILTELESYHNKFVDLYDDSVIYFVIDDFVYGYTSFKSMFGDLPTIWFEDCVFGIEEGLNGRPNLVKSDIEIDEDYEILEHEDLLELYTVLSMMNRIEKN